MNIEDQIITAIAKGKTIDEIYFEFAFFATRETVKMVWKKCRPLHPREWCALEDEIFERFIIYGQKKVQDELMKEGFHRTLKAIRSRKQVLGRMAKAA